MTVMLIATQKNSLGSSPCHLQWKWITSMDPGSAAKKLKNSGGWKTSTAIGSADAIVKKQTTRKYKNRAYGWELVAS